MATNKKNVQFDHLAPYYLVADANGGTDERRYDLSGLFAHISQIQPVETKKRIYGEVHYFHRCIFDDRSNVWEIQMLHLREKVIPGIADEDGTYELIQLEDGQFLAESTTVVYNPQECVLYFQRNMYGTSIRAFTEMLMHFAPVGTVILLKPVMHGTRISQIRESAWYSKVLLVADTDQLLDEDRNTSLGALLHSLRRYEGKIVKLELGVGRLRGRSLRGADASNLIREAYQFSGTQKLEVHAKFTEDAAFETIDLLDDRNKFTVPMTFSRENPITHSRLYNECINCLFGINT